MVPFRVWLHGYTLNHFFLLGGKVNNYIWEHLAIFWRVVCISVGKTSLDMQRKCFYCKWINYSLQRVKTDITTRTVVCLLCFCKWIILSYTSKNDCSPHRRWLCKPWVNEQRKDNLLQLDCTMATYQLSSQR